LAGLLLEEPADSVSLTALVSAAVLWVTVELRQAVPASFAFCNSTSRCASAGRALADAVEVMSDAASGFDVRRRISLDRSSSDAPAILLSFPGGMISPSGVTNGGESGIWAPFATTGEGENEPL
jgi:hypothetical protein